MNMQPHFYVEVFDSGMNDGQFYSITIPMTFNYSSAEEMDILHAMFCRYNLTHTITRLGSTGVVYDYVGKSARNSP